MGSGQSLPASPITAPALQMFTSLLHLASIKSGTVCAGTGFLPFTGPPHDGLTMGAKTELILDTYFF